MKVALTAVAAAAMMFGTLAASEHAEAKGRHFVIHKSVHVKHGFHKRHFHYGPPVVVATGCGFEKRMWLKTGSFFWKSKYYRCRGWW